jgi:predicted cation transporter
MTPAARSVRVFAVYLFVLSLALLFAPNTLLALFGFPATTEVWIRVVGMLVAILAMYYWTAAAAELTPFFRATVLGRICVQLFLLAFVLAGWSSWPLLLFGGVDLAGAAWTWMALRREAAPT